MIVVIPVLQQGESANDGLNRYTWIPHIGSPDAGPCPSLDALLTDFSALDKFPPNFLGLAGKNQFRLRIQYVPCAAPEFFVQFTWAPHHCTREEARMIGLGFDNAVHGVPRYHE